MGRILQDIYADSAMAMLLGLKGGTCAYFFYGLPRFSVDLDFDLLSDVKDGQAMIYQKIVKILEAYGRVKDRQIKRNCTGNFLNFTGPKHLSFSALFACRFCLPSKPFAKLYGSK